MTDPNDQPQDTTGDFAIPETHSGNAAFEGIDSYDKLFQGYADTHKAHSDLVDGQPVIPENADGYDITVPEGHTIDDGLMTAFKGWMHEAGMTNEKAQGLSNQFNEFIGEMANANEVEEGNKETALVDGLKKEWGSNFDNNAKVANDGLQRVFSEAKISQEDQDSFAQKFGNDPTAIKIFHAIGSKIGESAFFPNDGEPQNKGPGRTEGDTPMLHDYSKTTGN